MARLALALTTACALISLGAYGASGLAQALEIPIPRLEMTLSLRVAPKQLSRVEGTPVALDINSRISTVNGSQPPAIREIAIDLDRQIAIDARGLPVCQGGWRDIRFPDLKSRCKDAIVGGGRVGFQIELPGLPMTSSKSELVVINGGDRGPGGSNLYAVAHLAEPVTTAFAMTISIRRRSDGNQLIVDVPKLANDAGSLTHLRLRLKRRFAGSDDTVDFLTARCSSGRLQSEIEALFADGTIMQGDTLQTCIPKSAL